MKFTNWSKIKKLTDREFDNVLLANILSVNFLKSFSCKRKRRKIFQIIFPENHSVLSPKTWFWENWSQSLIPYTFLSLCLVVQTFHRYNTKGDYFQIFYSDWLCKPQKDKIQSVLFGNGTLLQSLFALSMRAILNLEIIHNGSK